MPRVFDPGSGDSANPSNEEQTTDAPSIDFADPSLILGPEVGLTFGRPGSGIQFGRPGQEPTLQERANRGELSYEVIPTDPELRQQVAFRTIGQIVQGEELSPWATSEIMSSIRAQASTPQLAYVLSNPDVIDDWQAAIWPNVLSNMVTDIPGFNIKPKDSDPYAAKVADFYKANDTQLSTDERKFISGLISAMPDPSEQLRARGIDPNTYNDSWWGTVQLGFRAAWSAPETIRGFVNDPRDALLAEMHEYLKANPIETPEDRAKFFLFATNRAQEAIKESGQNSAGFMALAEKTVALPFTVFGNEYNDWIYRSADPDHFASKQNLSIGRNLAIGMGVNPGDDWYTTVSGTLDGAVGVVFDPLNLAFGVGSGIRNAARVPRTVGVSKAQAFRDASRLFGGGRNLKLPVFDRGIVSRYAYAAFSKNLDEIVDTRQAWRQWDWIAQTDSATRIVERFPDWEQSTKLVEYLAAESDPKIVKELVRAGMQAPELLGADAPLLASKTADELAATVDRYVSRRQAWLDQGGSLQGLVSLDQVVDGGVFRVTNAPIPVDATELPVGELARLREIDPRRSLKTLPETGEIVEGGTRVDAIKASIKSKGFINDLENPVQVMVDPRTGETFLADGNHRITAMSELGMDAENIPVQVTEIRPGMLEYDMNLTKFEDMGDTVTFFPRQYLTGDILLRTGELTGDNQQKLVMTSLGGAPSSLDLSKSLDELVPYLDGRYGDDAAVLAAGGGLSDLSPDARKLVEQYVDAKGAGVGYLNGEAIATSRGRKAMVSGVDAPNPASTTFEDLSDEMSALVDAQRRYADVHNKTLPQLWVVKDTGVSLPTWTKQARQAMSTRGTKKYMQMLRRLGFRTTSTLPSNITLTETGEGAKQLRNWVKALGGTDETARYWADIFREGSASTRKDIILDALKDVGDEIGNPMLRDGLIEFGNKQGQYTYFYDRAGRELGLSADGRIKPMTLSHFTDTFAMPNARELIRSIKRWNQTQRFPRLKRGLLQSTNKERSQIASRLRTKMNRLGIRDISEEDLWSMAYADVLGAEHGRAAGYGALSKAAGMVGNGYRMLHNVFVIAQLAGRPIAWTSRVLLEETVRADLMGLPSLWRNPMDWLRQVWDTAQIRHIGDDLSKQADVAEGLVNQLFAIDGINWNRIDEVMPEFRAKAAKAGIADNSTAQLRALFSHEVGRQLGGLSPMSVGLRGNIERRAVTRGRKLERTFEKMDEYGLGDAFRWDIDGEDIANRSFWQGFVKESESATVPLEYSLGNMSQAGLQTYGRAYGRQMYQMISDPIIGNFGFSRAIARAEGATITHDAERLVSGSQWPKIKHIVDDRLRAEAGFEAMTELQKANWYLENVVDEVVETLWGPLSRGNLAEKSRILRALKNNGKVNVVLGDGINHTLDASRGNYEGFVKSAANLTESAYNDNIMLPRKIAGYLDPRYGMEKAGNPFRRVTDAIMLKFGENPTQKLNRQPAYRHIRSRYNNYYRSLGWSDEMAQQAAAEKAAELTNYIFFDNKNIPTMLHDMNKVIPFFSAMWEVGSTWLYKIPSQNILPVGYMQLGRRVQRTIRGLQASGLVSYDTESNEMTLNIDREMLNANGPLARNMGRGLFEFMRMPVTAVEQMAGLYDITLGDGDGETDVDLWAKDGFSIGIGNPLDFSSHGIMAVNQFSIGFTPLLQLPASMAANAVFANSSERVDVAEGTTVAEFLAANPEADIGRILRDNRNLFEEANGADVLTRALNYDWDLETLMMPTHFQVPESSLWETLVDRAFFPYGKLETWGQTVMAAVPSATEYVLRGFLIRMGLGDETEFLGSFLKSTTAFGTASEVLTQIQMLEASEGIVSKTLALSEQVQELVNKAELEVNIDPEGISYVLGNSPESLEANRLFREISALNAEIVKRANDNAGGSLIMRGIMGQLNPSTPRMWTREQQQIAHYWNAYDMKEQAKATGSVNFAESLAANPIRDIKDMELFGNLASKFLADPSGDSAKIWLRETYPALAVFAQGKSYWGDAGPPPGAQGFDAWVDAVEAGERKPFSPEVFMVRYLRSGIYTDREIGLIEEYGNDPEVAALDILADYDRYRSVVDEFDMQLDALEFLDARVFDGKYAAYRNDDVDDLSLYELVEERIRRDSEVVDTLQDLLDYGDLDPDERRRISGFVSAAQRTREDAIRDLNNLASNEEFNNPREKILNDYWDLSNEYYEARNAIFDGLDAAQNKDERSLVFEQARQLSDRWHNSVLTIPSLDGESQLVVPSPEVRSWNGKSQQERQERIMSMIGGKPEWLSQFESDLLANENPSFAEYLPVTTAQREVYDIATLEKMRINQAAALDPEITESQRERALRDVNEWLETQLANQGRFAELAYRDATPIQRLHMGGLIPPTLLPIIPQVNQIMEELKAEDKGPLSNLGFQKFERLVYYLETDYFVQNPQAKQDLLTLSQGMFGERLPSAAYSKMFQGALFGDEIRVG